MLHAGSCVNNTCLTKSEQHSRTFKQAHRSRCDGCMGKQLVLTSCVQYHVKVKDSLAMQYSVLLQTVKPQLNSLVVLITWQPVVDQIFSSKVANMNIIITV